LKITLQGFSFQPLVIVSLWIVLRKVGTETGGERLT
jgi:hypothetical protein